MEQTIRTLVRKLEVRFTLAESLKTVGAARAERPMNTSGRLGPSSPGRDDVMNLTVELELRLFEFVCDAKRFITPARIIPKNWEPLLAWLSFHSAGLAELEEEYVAGLVDELRYQIKKLDKLLNPDAPLKLGSEPWRPAGHIVAAAAAYGFRVTPGQLRQLVFRGVIDSRPGGARNLYRASQVLAYLRGEPTEKDTPQ
ncbi:hypothetical protein CPHO_07165 [Corynebacterium phocae]|uniref:Uncharacterized protein n=1 Tax=Corynebacterium phocae TaxID=161895 RepID=A0A1L7D3M5_9CORY|nr:hypothetical protein [Corynebacterium phocae]APT92705.1 hypothetical protein CPHO_07165 [Corynebacterium phocae]KAA8723010.1 hypothetical protein F4V58_06670 [Corynebacterium phocae]